MTMKEKVWYMRMVFTLQPAPKMAVHPQQKSHDGPKPNTNANWKGSEGGSKIRQEISK